MATYNDFLGEGGSGVNVQKPYDPNDEPNAANPDGVSNNQLKQTLMNRQASTAAFQPVRGQAQSQALGPGGTHTSAPAPLQWGQFGGTRAPAGSALTANAPNEFFADLARLGTAGANTLLPIDAGLEAVGFGEVPRAVVNPLQYGTRAATDEGADQLIPGGSGVSGSNLIPGVAGTGGDTMFPSETIGNDYGTGYRGRGNPLEGAPPGYNVGPAGGASSGGVAPAGSAPGSAPLPEVAGPKRPDSYRSDAVTPQIQALLAAEKRQGPSEAEALLGKATDRIAAQSLGIAAGARGGAGARERARSVASSTNAAMGSQASSDIAALRAREDADSRARQQAIMGLLAGNAEAGDARDLGYYGQDQSRASSRENLGATIASNERISQNELLQRAFDAEQNRELERSRFNAQQPTGFLDDPLGFGFNALTGGRLRSGVKI